MYNTPFRCDTTIYCSTLRRFWLWIKTFGTLEDQEFQCRMYSGHLQYKYNNPYQAKHENLLGDRWL